MKALNPEQHRKAVTLIDKLRSGTLAEEEISAVVTRLRTLLPDPHFMGYTVDRGPELSAEEN